MLWLLSSVRYAVVEGMAYQLMSCAMAQLIRGPLLPSNSFANRAHGICISTVLFDTGQIMTLEYVLRSQGH
jgi:hypothetical protein